MVEPISAVAGVVGIIKSIKEGLEAQESRPVLEQRLLQAVERMEFVMERVAHLESVLVSVQKDRDYFRDRSADLESDKKQLDAEKSELTAELSKYTDFIQIGGVLAKRIQDGSIGDIPFCPTCMNALSDMGSFLGCGSHGGFKARIDIDEFDSLVRSLNRKG